VYVIKNGDTLAKIGAEFGVSWQEIMRVNPGVNPNRLRIGQEILIPVEGN
jgi:LysM repeat protein